MVRSQPGKAYASLYDALDSVLVADYEDEGLAIHRATTVLTPGACLVLCTDGVHAVLGEAEMWRRFDPDRGPAEQLKAWQDRIWTLGAPDNLSLIIAEAAEQALPEMKKYGYDDSLATGCVAAAGSLGILIPPSTIFIVYGIMTEQSIGKLFIAGVLPGILLAGLMGIVVLVWCSRNPKAAPAGGTWLHAAPQPSVRCGASRAPHLHLDRAPGGRRPD